MTKATQKYTQRQLDNRLIKAVKAAQIEVVTAMLEGRIAVFDTTADKGEVIKKSLSAEDPEAISEFIANDLGVL